MGLPMFMTMSLLLVTFREFVLTAGSIALLLVAVGLLIAEVVVTCPRK